jgi:oligopeptide/dipeptide ABC transporter ATP-binding protein
VSQAPAAGPAGGDGPAAGPLPPDGPAPPGRSPAAAASVRAEAPAAGEPAAGTSLLEVEGLVTRYPVRRGLTQRLAGARHRWVRAVDGVSFTLARGEMLALVGESGCGKTTTAQTILGMVAPASGAVRLDGTDLTSMTERGLRPLRRRLQMIYQDPYESLDPRFRVEATITEPMLVHGIGESRAQRRELAAEALERAGLSPADAFMSRYPHELSGGQRQRVAIAASLVLGPDLLLADEPVSMLDVSVRAGVLSLLGGLRRDGRMGILMITHDLSTAAHFADRIAVMYLGRIVEQGPAREVVHHPRHPYTKALLSVVPPRDPREHVTPQLLTGETPDPVDVPPGCRFHPRCPVAQDRCRSDDPALRPPAPAHQAACHYA